MPKPKFECYDEDNLPLPVPLPESYRNLTLKKPFGQGTYQLKCNIIKKSEDSTLIEAYNRLVRVRCKDGIHWQCISVQPYQRRVPTRLIESDSHFK